MFGLRTTFRRQPSAWHAHAGDAIEDSSNVPGIVLFFVGIAALAATIVAAGSGFVGWAVIGAIVTALALIAGISIILFEHAREKSVELKFGRHGHNPLVH